MAYVVPQEWLPWNNGPSETIDLNEYDPSVLSDRSQLVYHQWIMDETDELLIYGFFRFSNEFGEHPLPKDINKIIASYYTKSETKFNLKHVIVEIDSAMDTLADEKHNRTKYMSRKINHCCGCSCLILLAITFIFAPDIAGLIIASSKDCDASLDDDVSFGINTFLLVGCSVHSCFYVLLICAISIYLVRQMYCYGVIEFVASLCTGICMLLFFISWNGVGANLYSQIPSKNENDCANIVIAIVVVRLFECFIMISAAISYLFWTVFENLDYF